MSTTTLTTLEINPVDQPRASIIWMHGLGADAHDFEPIVPELRLAADLGVRFVFPNAPMRPVTINGGMTMRAWYDILTIDLPRREDAPGIRESETSIRSLIDQEQERGIDAKKIVLAGFSQGGAMALHTGLRYPEPLAGILALSCYLLLADRITEERHPANQQTPLFIAHGDADGVIPLSYGHAAATRLESLGYHVEWHDYPMEHAVCWEEIRDVSRWLDHILR